MTVHVYRRSSDWHACIDGNKRKWGCGTTVENAVADCLRSHAPDAVPANGTVDVKLTLPLPVPRL